MENLRRQIDLLDDQIMDLLNQRFDIVKDVKAFKKDNSVAVLDLKREEFIMGKTRQYDNAYALEEVYKKILKVSKELQK